MFAGRTIELMEYDGVTLEADRVRCQNGIG